MGIRARRVCVLLSWSPAHRRGSRSQAQLGVTQFYGSTLPGGRLLAREIGFIVQTADLIKGCLKTHWKGLLQTLWSAKSVNLACKDFRSSLLTEMMSFNISSDGSHEVDSLFKSSSVKHQRVPVHSTISALSPFLFRVENNWEELVIQVWHYRKLRALGSSFPCSLFCSSAGWDLPLAFHPSRATSGITWSNQPGWAAWLIPAVWGVAGGCNTPVFAARCHLTTWFNPLVLHFSWCSE